MLRLYIMPIIGTGTKLDPRRPKYAATIDSAALLWSMMDYGYRPTCLVGSDTDTTVHAALTANADVYAFPDNFQSSGATVGNQTNTVSTRLESFAIPAHWIATQDTYLSVAHTVGAMFQFMQRLNGVLGNVDPFVGATLNSQIRDLPASVQEGIFLAGSSFGWNMGGISSTTTIRNAIKYMADQWGATPLLLGGFVF